MMTRFFVISTWLIVLRLCAILKQRNSIIQSILLHLSLEKL